MTKEQVEDVPSPSDKLLVSPVTSPVDDDKVKMKKQLGLLEGCAIIVGIICGSGVINTNKLFVFYFSVAHQFSRNIHFTKGYNSRSIFTRFFSNSLGIMWSAFDDWSLVLCRIRYIYTKIWR